jgi:hypothetical protein
MEVAVIAPVSSAFPSAVTQVPTAAAFAVVATVLV